MQILIINGPNLNRLGVRKPEIYGTTTMAQILLDIQRQWPDVHFVYKQSNHAGDLIDWIQEANGELINGDATLNDVAGIVINAGGYAHTSVALRDAVEESEVPVVEVHISDIHTRANLLEIQTYSQMCAPAQ